MGVISRVWPYFLIHAERCAVVTVLFHLICGSFVQTTGREVTNLPVSHELGKNIYSMYSVQRVHEGEGGLQFVEVTFACCRFHSSDAVVFVSCFGRLLAGWLFCELRSELIESALCSTQFS